jgi:hypothetical protein
MIAMPRTVQIAAASSVVRPCMTNMELFPPGKNEFFELVSRQTREQIFSHPELAAKHKDFTGAGTMCQARMRLTAHSRPLSRQLHAFSLRVTSSSTKSARHPPTGFNVPRHRTIPETP